MGISRPKPMVRCGEARGCGTNTTSHQIIHLRASQTVEPTNPPTSTPGLVTMILGDTALLESLVGSMA